MGRCPRERRTLARSPDRPLARGTGAPPAFPGRGGRRRLRSPGPPALRGSAWAAAPKNRRGCPGSPSSRPSPAAPSSPPKQRPREGKSGESCQHEGESGLGSPATPVGGCSGDLRLSRDGGMREWPWILRGNPQRRGVWGPVPSLGRRRRAHRRQQRRGTDPGAHELGLGDSANWGAVPPRRPASGSHPEALPAAAAQSLLPGAPLRRNVPSSWIPPPGSPP